MADALDKGVSVIANAKQKRPITSHTARMSIGVDNIAGCKIVCPLRQVSSIKINIPPNPNNAKIRPIDVVSAADLISMSSIENAAIAATIKRLPLVLFKITPTMGRLYPAEKAEKLTNSADKNISRQWYHSPNAIEKTSFVYNCV